MTQELAPVIHDATDETPAAPEGGTPGWWRSAVIYQVYVRSFADGDGDGVGDLPGIRARLPYLAELGADAVWLTPSTPRPRRTAATTSPTTAASTPSSAPSRTPTRSSAPPTSWACG